VPCSQYGILADTHGCEPLLCTVTELAQTQEQVGQIPLITRFDGDDATSATVLAGMENHSWVHLAYYTSQSVAHPMASAFHLHDSVLDLGTIMRKSLKHQGLAFLSACQTAARDDRMPEKAVHLAGWFWQAILL
jgi:CHAT domain-containing protein